MLSDAPYIGQSPEILDLVRRVERIASRSTPVLIVGETGTGRKHLARLIHRRSARADAPLRVLEAARLSANLDALVASAGGSLYLEEVGDLTSAAQERLIETLAAMPTPSHARVMAATGRNLEDDIREGRFRRELYHQLNVTLLLVPPLRRRMSDLPLLVAHFLAGAAIGTATIEPDALEALARYDFPANVAELQTILGEATARASGTAIQVADLPARLRA